MFLDKFVLKFQSTSENVMSKLFLLNLNTINMCSFPVHNIKSLVDRCFGVRISHPLHLHHHLLHPDSLPVLLPTPVPLPLLPLPLHVSLSPPLYHLCWSNNQCNLIRVLWLDLWGLRDKDDSDKDQRSKVCCRTPKIQEITVRYIYDTGNILNSIIPVLYQSIVTCMHEFNYAIVLRIILYPRYQHTRA